MFVRVCVSVCVSLLWFIAVCGFVWFPALVLVPGQAMMSCLLRTETGIRDPEAPIMVSPGTAELETASS